MPTYEYECRSCGKGFELFQSIAEMAVRICPSCGKEEVRRIINGGMGVIFKGSGFYKNDSRAPESSSATPAAAPSPACESCSSSPVCESAKKEAV